MDPIFTVVVLTTILPIVGIVLIFTLNLKIAPPGAALVRFGQGGTLVSFSKMMVYPIVHRLEYMDIRLKHFSIELANEKGVLCRNNLRVDLRADVFMRVFHSAENVVAVAQSVGCERAGQIDTIRNLFEAKILEAIKVVTKEFDYEDILHNLETYKSHILDVIGGDLNGYLLDNFNITSVSLTAQKYLDPNNILDAEALQLMTKKLAEVQQVNLSQEAKLQQHLQEESNHFQETKLFFNNQKQEIEALHKALIRFLEEQAILDERIIRLEVQNNVETSTDIKNRLEKQIEEIKQKKAALTTQLEVEERSIKVRYQRKILNAQRSNEFPPETK